MTPKIAMTPTIAMEIRELNEASFLIVDGQGGYLGHGLRQASDCHLLLAQRLNGRVQATSFSSSNGCRPRF